MMLYINLLCFFSRSKSSKHKVIQNIQIDIIANMWLYQVKNIIGSIIKIADNNLKLRLDRAIISPSLFKFF